MSLILCHIDLNPGLQDKVPASKHLNHGATLPLLSTALICDQNFALNSLAPLETFPVLSCGTSRSLARYAELMRKRTQKRKMKELEKEIEGEKSWGGGGG
jgi:hypothetical protein